MNKINYSKMDKELIPVIRELNKVGIKTIGCCTGHGEEDAFISIDLESTGYVSIGEDRRKGVLLVRWNIINALKTKQLDSRKYGGE